MSATAVVRQTAVSMPRLFLRLEGLALFAAAVAAYIYLHGSAWLFIVLLLAPDLALLAYLANPKLGSVVYNLAHTILVAGLLCAAALLLNSESLLLIGLIWLAHIGMDRAVGYGFKYPTSPKDTHLGRV